MSKHKLLFVGFGNVGQAFARFLLDPGRLSQFTMPEIKVVGIVTGSGGCLANNDGVDLKRALYEKSTYGRFSDENPDRTERNSLEIISAAHADIMIEMSSLDIISGQPAIDYIKTAFEHKMDVITLNKGPLAFAYHELDMLAKANRCRFLFEGTVMDGTPVFNLIKENLKGCRITGFRGILNSTTNYILCEMEHGHSLENSVRKAQKLGFAETDPAFDILGWDSAFKTTILMNVLMDAKITPREIDRCGISLIKMSEVNSALRENKRMKLVCEGYLSKGKPTGRVRPVSVTKENILSNIDGTSSILTLQTDEMGDITIAEHHPDLKQTLYAIISDLMQIFRNG